MSQLDGFLLPETALPPGRLKKLGQALLAWCDGLQTRNVGAFVDPGPVQDLLAGELPKPFALRALETGEGGGESLKAVREALGASASARIVRVGLNPADMTAADFVESLRDYLPSNTVAQVIVGDESFRLD